MKNGTTIHVAMGAGFETWRLQAEPVNALSPLLLQQLREAIARAANNDSISAVILTSGCRVFSAGGDARWMGEVLAAEGKQGLVDRFNGIMNEFREVCIALRRSPFLVIAALNGHTLAGGLELASACDLRFAADNPKIQIGVPEMDLFGAMPTGGGGAQFLTRILGPSRALDFILDAKPVSPQRALEMGLVDRVFAAGELLPSSEAYAADIAKKAGRIGVNAAKKAILGGAEIPLLDAMELDRSLHWDAMRRGNFLPGVEAFVERFGR
jgi:enoyl-CoA hydratase/carnithine racemase